METGTGKLRNRLGLVFRAVTLEEVTSGAMGIRSLTYQGRLPSNAWNGTQDSFIHSLLLWVLVRLGLCAKPSPGSHR